MGDRVGLGRLVRLGLDLGHLVGSLEHRIEDRRRMGFAGIVGSGQLVG